MVLSAGLIGLFVAAYLALGLLAWRRPLLARLAFREAVRRPWQSALVVAGLMVGGAAIFSMQAAVDSAVDSATASAYEGWGHVDVTASRHGELFRPELATQLAADPLRSPQITGVQGGLELIGSVADLDRGRGKAQVRLVGFDPGVQKPFGLYVLEDGRRTDGTELGASKVILSRGLADALDARPRDRVRLAMAGQAADLTVAGVARREGPGRYGLRPAAFMSLAALQSLSGERVINVIRIGAGGQGQQEIDAAHASLPSLRAALDRLPGGGTLQLREDKARDAEDMVRWQEGNATITRVVGLLVALSGATLIANVLLGQSQERRPRLAVLRALGLSRSGLVYVSLLEGSFYSLAAAVSGLLPGAIFGFILTQQFLSAALNDDPRNWEIGGRFSIHPLSVPVSVAGAGLIMLATLVLISLRTSRMTIASAIKDLPEPAARARPGRMTWLTPAVLALTGVVGLASGQVAARVLAGSALILAAALVARGRLGERARWSALGAALTTWAFANAAFSSNGLASDASVAIQLTTMVVSVFGLCILVAANLRLLEAILHFPRGSPSWLRAALRPPLAYLTRRPIRSGLATGALALVVATLTILGVVELAFLSTFEAGRYDVAVQSPNRSVVVPHAVQSRVSQELPLATVLYLGRVASREPRGSSMAIPGLMRLYGIADSDLDRSPLLVRARESRFRSDAEVWQALKRDPTLVVSPRANPGSTWTFQSPTGPVSYRVAARVADINVNGLAGSERALAPFATAPWSATVLLQLRPGADATAVARDIGRSLSSQGVDVTTSAELQAELAKGFHAFLGPAELLMSMGVGIGVASLGILALRAVIERRRAIGLLRALGYRRGAILAGMLLEALLTATSGVVVGLLVGAVIGRMLVTSELPDAPLRFDYGLLATTIGVIYVVVLLVTPMPALRASQLAPAEALRLVE
jgi:putative ABC transport system permease protein